MDKKMYATDMQELVQVVVPTKTKTYRPISHGQLIDLTRKSIDKAGFTLLNEAYTSARDGRQANGRYVISSVSDPDMSLMIGWQNSYDKSLSLKFAIGGHIFICSNGAIKGDLGTFRKKHWGDIQEFTPAHIQDYINGAGETFETLRKDKDLMKQVEVSVRESAELVGRMLIEDSLITITQLGIIKGQIENPSYNYGNPNSAWALYNHTTFSLRETHPSNWMKQHIDVHEFFSKNVLQ